MDEVAFGTIKVTCWIIASISGVLGAWFKLQNYWQTSEERDKTEEYYIWVWSSIDDLNIKELPYKIIEKTKYWLDQLSRTIKRPFDLDLSIIRKNHRVVLTIVFIISLVFPVTAFYDLHTNNYVIAIQYVIFSIVFLTAGSASNWSKSVKRIKFARRFDKN